MNWFLFILLVGFCIPECKGFSVRCIDHYLYLNINDEVHEVVCWNITSALTIVPSLPTGLIFDNGIIFGNPVNDSPLKQYQIMNDTVVGSFWLSVSSFNSYVSVGFTSRVVYIDCPIVPITVFTDGKIKKYTILPPLEGGLQFDANKRIIYGTYTGKPDNVTYLLSVYSKYYTQNVSFTLQYTFPYDSFRSISQCTFLYASSVHQPLEWYNYNTPTNCTSINALSVHKKALGQLASRYVGTLFIDTTANHTFNVRFTDGLVMYLDNEIQVYQTPKESTFWNITISLPLTRGYHLIEIIHVYLSFESYLEMYYKLNDEWVLVNETMLVAGGVSPFNFHSQDVITFVQHSVTTPTPTVNGYPCAKYTLSHTLPSHLSLDPTTGEITGSPTNTGYNEYSLTCVSVFGSAQIPLVVSVSSGPQAGLQVTYYYSEYGKFAVSLIENSLDHPLVESGMPWPSLPLSLFRGFTANWDGFILTSKNGEHILRFVVSGGIRVWVENIILLDHWDNKNPGASYEVPLTFKKNQYYALKVEYICYGFESGIRFYMKHPGSSQYKIPGVGELFTDIQEEFRYTLKEMVCVVNTTIISNNPLFNYHSAASFMYEVIPSLPKGLELSNGVITGIPLEVMEPKTFIIIASTSYKKLKTKVMIEVQSCELPSNLFIYDLLGHHLTSFSCYQYSSVIPLMLYASVSNVLWRVSPTLPKGFVLDNQSHRITGRALSIFPNTTFTFYAQSTGGITSFDFPIAVEGCEHGLFLYTSFSESSKGEFHLNGEGQQIDEEIVTGDYGIVMCLPQQVYTIQILCSSQTACLFHLISEGGLTMIMRTIPPLKLDEFQFDYTDKSPPEIFVSKSTIVTRVSTPVHIFFLISHPFYSVTFHPLLPSQITFNQQTLELYGEFSTATTVQFTIIATNDYGSDNVGISIYVDKCPNGSELFQLSRSSSESGESLVISKDDEFVYAFSFSGESYNEFICLSSNLYTIIMKDSDGNGWVPGSDLVIHDSLNRVCSTFILDAGESSVIEYLDCAKLVQEQSSLRYLISAMAPSSDWTSCTYVDSFWSLGSSPNWNTVPSSLATVYFRRVVTLSPGSLAIHLFFRDGCVVYIDGVEIDRFNLPAGPIYHSTAAVSRFTSPCWITAFSPFYTSKREVVIAVEIHRYYVVTSSKVDFDLVASQNYSPQLLVSFGGAGFPLSAFDGSRQTAWYEMVPANASYTFKHKAHYPINRIDLSVGPQFQWDAPSSFVLYGNKDKPVEICSLTSKSMFKSPFGVFSLQLPEMGRYSSLFVDIKESLNSRSFDIRSIAFYYSMVPKCMQEGKWPETPRGSTSLGKCSHMFGKTKRRCLRKGMDGVWGVVSTQECVDSTPKLGVVYLETSIVFTNTTETIWEETISPAFGDILLGKVKGKVRFLPFNDCSTAENLMFEVGVHIEVNRKEKGNMLQHLNSLQANMQSELSKKGLTMISAQFKMNIVIRDSVLVVLFCGISLLLLLLIVCVILLIRKMVKKRRMNYLLV